MDPLLEADFEWLKAFHVCRQHPMVSIKWLDFMQKVTVSQRSGLPSSHSCIQRRHCMLFGYVIRMNKDTPAHRALQLSFDGWRGAHPGPTCTTCGAAREIQVFKGLSQTWKHHYTMPRVTPSTVAFWLAQHSSVDNAYWIMIHPQNATICIRQTADCCLGTPTCYCS